MDGSSLVIVMKGAGSSGVKKGCRASPIGSVDAVAGAIVPVGDAADAIEPVGG